MTEAGCGVEGGKGGRARAGVVLGRVGLTGLAHWHAFLKKKDVTLVAERTGLIERGALKEMRVPFKSTQTEFGSTGERGVVEDGGRWRAWLANMKSGVPDRSSSRAQLTLQSGGVENRLDIGAVMRNQALTLFGDIVVDRTRRTQKLALSDCAIPGTSGWTFWNHNAGANHGIIELTSRADGDAFAEQGVVGCVFGAGRAEVEGGVVEGRG